jgi:hypothetical protein
MAEIRTFRTYGLDTDDGRIAKIGDEVWVISMVHFDGEDVAVPFQVFGGVVSKVEQWGAEVSSTYGTYQHAGLEREPKAKIYRDKDTAMAFVQAFWEGLDKKRQEEVVAAQERVKRAIKQRKECEARSRDHRTEEQAHKAWEEIRKHLKHFAEDP